MKINYTIFHSHSDLSILDSATKSEAYINKAKELDMNAFGESNHGNVLSWLDRKEKTNNAGLKYIHAIEAYVTESLEEKIRDNYHIILIARNWEGVKEINELSSLSYDEKHFYYNPRLAIDEIIDTSQNVIITTACLAGILSKGSDKTELVNKFINFLKQNKERVFLEIQPHQHNDQIEYNKYLYELSKQHSLNMIAGTDTHALNQNLSDARKILMKSKNIEYTNEDEFDLTFKTYEELVDSFKKQNALPEKIYMEAIENTNKLADMIDDFELDKSKKYPKLYKNPEKAFKEKINQGVIERKIDKLPPKTRQQYYDRIKYEFDVYKKCDSIELMLLQKDIEDYGRKNDIYTGPSRGSVSGSIIAYVLGITDADSIKFDLSFERFMNPERISEPDIDLDYTPEERDIIKDYLFEKDDLYCSEIITFNTIALKGAIRDVGRALEIPLQTVDAITKNIDINESEYRQKYPKLFKYVDLLQGINVSIGIHPAGILVSPYTLEDNVGILYTSTSNYPISQVNMKELDKNNWIKLDLLGLDNVGIINKTCKLAGIERITPDNIDSEDENVWNSILEDNLLVFQWESDFAYSIYKKLFSPETINKIKEKAPNISYMDLFSMGNGSLRPGGASYRDKMCEGIFNDNGHEALNKMLESTMFYLVYQEQVLEFLNKFCGYTMGQADIIRRGFAKKTGTEQYIPEIKKGFIKTMKQDYNMDEKEAEEIVESFLKVIEDSSDYLFSLNHSYMYSWIGYMCAWLRYYYPLEFLTVALNVHENSIERTSRIYNYAKKIGIKILPIQFGKSRSEYSMVKEENSIYQGIASIKYLNSKIAQELYDLSQQKEYKNFLDLLMDIKQHTSVNSNQLEILITLNFFSDFGQNQKLLTFNKIYSQLGSKKQIKKQKIDELSQLYSPITHETIKPFVRETEKSYMDFQSYEFLQEIWNQIPDKSLPINEQILKEKEYLGYAYTTKPDVSEEYNICLEVDKKYSPKVLFYNINTGEEKMLKVSKKLYYDKRTGEEKFDIGDLIKIQGTEERYKKKFDEEKEEWVETEEKEKWLIAWSKILQN